MKSKHGLKVLVLFIVLLFGSIQPASAGLGIVDQGAKMIEDGIFGAMMKIGDDLYSAGVKISGSNETKAEDSASDDMVVNSIFKMATFTPDLTQLEVVKYYRTVSVLMYIVLFLIFLFGCGSVAIIRHINPRAMEKLAYISGVDQSNTSTKDFLIKAVMAELIVVIVYVAIDYLLKLNYVLSGLTMVGVLDSIAPTTDNVPMYIAMGILYFTMSFFFVYRILIIGFAQAFGLIILAGWLWAPTKGIVEVLIVYFLMIVFSQTLFVGLTSFVVYFSKGMIDMNLIYAGSDFFFYLAAMLIMVGIGIIIMIFPVFGIVYKLARVVL